MANSRRCSYSASNRLTNCHSDCAKNSQNTASINTGKYRKNKLGWVIFSLLRQIYHLSWSQIANTPCRNNVPHTLIDFLKVSVGWGIFGGKKATKKQDSSNILSDNTNEALFHITILARGVFLPPWIFGNGCSLMGYSSVCCRFTHIQHKHPKVQLQGEATYSIFTVLSLHISLADPDDQEKS